MKSPDCRRDRHCPPRHSAKQNDIYNDPHSYGARIGHSGHCIPGSRRSTCFCTFHGVYSSNQVRAFLIDSGIQIGIVSNRHTPSDYDDDMRHAKSLGIDAFALNIGVDPYTDQQLQLAYESASQNSIKVFLSFDFNWWSTGQAGAIGQKIAQYAGKPAQLMVDNKTFVSSFAGDGLDVAAMRAAAGRPLFFAPNFHPSYGTNLKDVDGLLNWMAWPNNGQNKAPTPDHNISVADGDQEYVSALAGKAYIARQSSMPCAALTFFTLLMINSRLPLVLHPLRARSLVQQELGLPLRSTLVQPMARSARPWPSLHRDRDLE